MKSRMDKYYKDEELMQRTSKNDSLYDELYREKKIPKSNVTVIDNISEIDISKIKTMVDSRENYKRVKDYGLVSDLDDYKNNDIDYNFDEIDYSNYDINEIIRNKKECNSYEKDPNKIRNITSKEYEIISSLEVKNNEFSEDLLNHEKQLKDLFNTVSQTAINESTDLFSNLKEDVDKNEDLVKEETFYTSTSKFDEDDFKEEIVEKNNSKWFIIIGVLALIIAISVIVYIKFFN